MHAHVAYDSKRLSVADVCRIAEMLLSHRYNVVIKARTRVIYAHFTNIDYLIAVYPA